ncbi:hypothetical protein ACFQUU_27910 [Herbaspirillum sp. GCM10030257]|uniref:hypothetical protein n=1 Tax=Herbaspirillum sp. GCM10030257 TaxID=3273393 RepID=UPI003622EFA4
MAAYVCPELAKPAMSGMMEGMPCADMDKEKPVHCVEFQSGADLALEHLAAPPVLTPVVVSFIQPASVSVTSTIPLSRWNESSPETGVDPPYLRTLRLRI